MNQAIMVGVTGSLRVREGAERASVNASYVHSVANAGGIPLVLTPAIGLEHVDDVVAKLDALVLTGGHDVDPALYDTAPSPALGPLDRGRDEFEIALFNAARQREIPVLGICRGLQVINVAMGGTLWQDLPSERPGAIAHEASAARDARVHEVRVKPGTHTAEIIGRECLTTNSFHHQAVRSLAKGLTATAWAPDGVVEGVEGSDQDGWLLAVQWHPEEFLREAASADQGLFQALIGAVRRDRALQAASSG